MSEQNAVDEYVGEEMLAQRIPGMALAVMRDPQVIAMGAYGLANVELNVPVSPQTLFQSGSLGKQFVAAAIMLLAEDGTISLDENLSELISKLRPIPGQP